MMCIGGVFNLMMGFANMNFTESLRGRKNKNLYMVVI